MVNIGLEEWDDGRLYLLKIRRTSSKTLLVKWSARSEHLFKDSNPGELSRDCASAIASMTETLILSARLTVS